MSRVLVKKSSNSGLVALIALLFAGLVPVSGVVAADEEAVIIEETLVTGSRI